ncbi:hypothetical protein HK104_002720 [Borealophlyctis nickersoniae]|nr:hypothetical protein HK104_002720 [Borealophlyctis nickersoniae]
MSHLLSGTTQPLSCNALAYCPEGSKSASKIGVIVLFGAFAVLAYFGFKWRAKTWELRVLKHKYQVDSFDHSSAAGVGAAMDSGKPQLAKLSRTFDIRFENLGKTLPSGVQIMKGVTGELKSGRTCAIMGPSGAGKTTFVTLLTGKMPRTSGTVYINEQKEELSKYKKLIGYVPQEDIMLRELTVRDILMHSARMRLPKDWDFERVKRKVLEIIHFLGMAHVMDNVIGNEEERGISGGQRKRVNIGMELVAEPSVLFLDEPTSGLDSSTAFEVCSNLRNIAQQQGLTVAAVIHSPSPAAFRQFDDLLLLGKGGQVAYFGPREEAVAYFDMIGFTCPIDESQSDFFMDLVSGKVPSAYEADFKPSDLFGYWAEYKQGRNPFAGREKQDPYLLASQRTPETYPEKSEESKDPLLSYTAEAKRAKEEKLRKKKLSSDYYNWTDSVAAALAVIFRDWGAWFKDVFLELVDFLKSIAFSILRKKDPVRDTCPFYMQFWLLTKRAYHQIYRNWQSFIFEQLLHLSCGLFISIATQNFGYVGAQPPEVCATSAWNLQWYCRDPRDFITQAAMFIMLGVSFAGISVGTSTFGRERVVFWRDTSTGMSTTPYYLAKFFVDIPRIFIGAFMFSCALILFFPYRQRFASILLLIELMYFGAFAMGYFLSIAFKPAQVSLVGTGFALLWALVLSGVMPNLADVYNDSGYNPIRWLWEWSAPRWAIEAFWIKEVSGYPFVRAEKPPNHYDWNNWNLDLTNITEIWLIWNVIAFLSLKLFDRAKQK